MPWQGRDRRPFVRNRRNVYFAAVALNDPAADKQAESMTAGLGRELLAECLGQVIGINTAAGIADREDELDGP